MQGVLHLRLPAATGFRASGVVGIWDLGFGDVRFRRAEKPSESLGFALVCFMTL